MNKIRFYVALICARLVYLVIRILNKSSGTSFVGMLSLKLCPKFLEYCRKYVQYAIAVTGTNGKTTTSGLLAHILEESDNDVIHNVKGANMITGIANMFALNVAPFKTFDYAVIESDEAYLRILYDSFDTDFLIVTNLFRDQLDRYGELSTTASFIQAAIDKNQNLSLVLNADDPLVSSFGKGRDATYFGFEQVEDCTNFNNSIIDDEIFNCPICQKTLKYNKQFMAHEGHYVCPDCEYSRPEVDYKGYVKIYADYSDLTVKYKDSVYEFKINLVGLYNAYNALAAIACALENGIDYKVIKTAVESYKTMFGRAERRIINGHKTLIQLIKNPAGAGEVLKTLDLDSNIVIAMNDNYADGRDISWIWSCDFERLKDAKRKIVVSGLRAKDVALRLKYAGIQEEKIIIEEDLHKAVEIVANSDDNSERITILPSYTALLKISKMKF